MKWWQKFAMRGGVATAGAVAGLLVAWGLTMCSTRAPAHAAGTRATPCSTSVTDHTGTPIFGVPCYGGPYVLGDVVRVFAPGRIAWPSLVLAYASPDVYADGNAEAQWAVRCQGPARWVAPQGDWWCARGRWVKGPVT